ncbi:MAG TPA: glycosyltransferase family A protein [Acidimicrobiales bacterium]
MKHTRLPLVRTRAVGIVIPAHNEFELLGAALMSLEIAIAALGAAKVEVGVAVVLDSCSDDSDTVVREWMRRARRRGTLTTAMPLECDAKNVGIARGLGCAALLNTWDDIRAGEIWLATTDADSRVPPQWLSAQVLAHERGADLWTGRVAVTDWENYGDETIARWTAGYEAEEYPIHGTSMGFNAWHYMKVGGFAPLQCGEDRELFRLLVESGAHWSHNPSLRVTTSSRRFARAPGGFAHVLELMDSSIDLSDRGDDK